MRNTLSWLRPQGMGEILDGAIRLYRGNFLRFTSIVAVMQLPLTLAQILLSLLLYHPVTTAAPDDLSFATASSMSTLFGSLASMLLIQVIANTALTYTIAEKILGKQDDHPQSLLANLQETYSRAAPRMLRLFVVLLLSGLVTLALMLWFVIPCIGWFTGAGLLVFWYGGVTPLLIPVVVLENTSITGALRRAWDLARQRILWLVAFSFLLYLFNLVVIGGPSGLLSLVSLMLTDSALDARWQAALSTGIESLISLIGNLLYLPLYSSTLALVYFNLRSRREGLDLTLRANALAAQPLPAQEIVARPVLTRAPVPGQNQWLTGRELSYLVTISVVVAGIIGLFFGGLALLGFLINMAAM